MDTDKPDEVECMAKEDKDKASSPKGEGWKKRAALIALKSLPFAILVAYSIWFFLPYTVAIPDYACRDTLRNITSAIISYEVTNTTINLKYNEVGYLRELQVEAYKNGTYPTSIEELVAENYIRFPEDERGGVYHFETAVVTDSGATYEVIYPVCSMHGSLDDFTPLAPEKHWRWENVEPEQMQRQVHEGYINIAVFLLLIILNIVYGVLLWRKKAKRSTIVIVDIVSILLFPASFFFFQFFF
jgi:hypothetical protein